MPSASILTGMAIVSAAPTISLLRKNLNWIVFIMSTYLGGTSIEKPSGSMTSKQKWEKTDHLLRSDLNILTTAIKSVALEKRTLDQSET